MGFRFGPPRVSGFELFRDGHPIAAELEPLLRRVAADPVLRGVARPGGPGRGDPARPAGGAGRGRRAVPPGRGRAIGRTTGKALDRGM